MLAGLDTAVKGTVLCNGEDITKKGLNYHRKHNISLVFQNYNLIDYLTTVENVKLGGSGNAEKLLEEVGIGKEYWQRNVLQLSGGQQQRVAIARALASEKTEDTFINIPIYTESHNLSILGNLYRQTRHLLESVMIYR